jgi:Cys-rich repeat protein
MRRPRLGLTSFAAAMVLLGLFHCGGSTLPADPGPGDGGHADTAPVNPDGMTPTPVAVHRPSPVACPSTGATGTSCARPADCATAALDGGALNCVRGTCSSDQCLSDTDCPNGGVCSCQGGTRGFAGVSPGNLCVPANCRVDADCGAGGFCSPTVDASCGSFYGIVGYYCHTSWDTCHNDADCGGDGSLGAPYCAYDPQVGHWACGNGHCAG